MSSTELTRHARAWLAATTWRAHLASCDGAPAASLAASADGRAPSAAIQPLESLTDWIARGRALVVRRRAAADTGVAGADACSLAVALPLADGRRRIAIVVDRAAVERVAPPLRLDEVIRHAPPDRRLALADLQRAADAADTTLHVYGSYAWQAISGEACVTSTSDLDLLWDARDPHHARCVIATLLRWEAESGLRADGEARFANGDAVAWRELASSARRVLVKRDDGVALVRTPMDVADHDARNDEANDDEANDVRSYRQATLDAH